MNTSIFTWFYLNPRGEMMACVEVKDDSGLHCKLIENIEKFNMTPEMYFEEAIDGFSGFSDYDPASHNEMGYHAFLEETLEEQDYRILAIFGYKGVSVEYFFDNMDDQRKTLFSQIKVWTDDLEEKYLRELDERRKRSEI